MPQPSTPPLDPTTLGRVGEHLAAYHLEAKGFRVLDRNWRHQFGELDIVAIDARTAVAVEVKTRSGTAYGHPFEAITTEKVKRLRRLLLAWVREAQRAGRVGLGAEFDYDGLRIDAVGIILRRGHEAQVEHLQGVG